MGSRAVRGHRGQRGVCIRCGGQRAVGTEVRALTEDRLFRAGQGFAFVSGAAGVGDAGYTEML